MRNPICKYSLSRLKNYRWKLIRKLFQQEQKAAREGEWQDITATQNAHKKIGLLSNAGKLLKSAPKTKKKAVSIKLNSDIWLKFCISASLKWKWRTILFFVFHIKAGSTTNAVTAMRCFRCAYCLSTDLLHLPELWAETVCSSHVSLFLSIMGEKKYSFGFVSYLVNGSWSVLLTARPHFQFRVGKGENVGAVLSDPDLYPSCY